MKPLTPTEDKAASEALSQSWAHASRIKECLKAESSAYDKCEKAFGQWLYFKNRHATQDFAAMLIEIKRHTYAEDFKKGIEKLEELIPEYYAAVEARRQTEREAAQFEASLEFLLERVQDVFSSSFSEALEAIRSKVWPVIFPLCEAEEWTTPEQVAQRIFESLPRVGRIQVKENIGRRGGKNRAGDISAMHGAIVWLQETSAAK